MPTIALLNLTISRDTNGVITVRVDYTLKLSVTEVTADIPFAERVALIRRFGQTDRYELDGPGGAPTATVEPGDRRDRVVAILADKTISANGLGLLPGAREAARSFTRVLTAAELNILLEVGREQPYAMVSVIPTEIMSDVRLAPVEIDVGDPVSGPSFDAGGEPVALAVDGKYLYIATKEGAVTKLDRNGGLMASFPVGGALSSIGFDGANLWVTAGDTVTKVSPDGTILGTFRLGSASAVAIAFGPAVVWIAHYSGTISMLGRDGASMGTRPSGNNPWSIATTAYGDALVVCFGAGIVQLFTSTGIPTATYPVGSNPWDIAVVEGTAWVTSFAEDRVTVINTADGSIGTFVVGSGPKGIAAGAEAIWIVSSLTNELIKVRAADRTVLASYPVGEGADRVVFDSDRVFVANRQSRNVTLIPVV